EGAGVRRRREVWVAGPEQSGVEVQEDRVESGDPLPGQLDQRRRPLRLIVIKSLANVVGGGHGLAFSVCTVRNDRQRRLFPPSRRRRSGRRSRCGTSTGSSSVPSLYV